MPTSEFNQLFKSLKNKYLLQ